MPGSWLSTACCALLLACGGHYDSNPDAGGTAAISSAGAPSSADAAAHGETNQTSDFLLGPPLPYHGVVQFGWYGTPVTTIAEAMFASPTMTFGLPSSCSPFQTLGKCQLFNCGPGSSTGTAPQAGPIQIADGLDFNVWLQTYDGAYVVYHTPGNQLPGGERLTVSAAGGEVPAFSGVVTQPDPLVINTPATLDGMLPWSRDRDLTLTFQGGAASVELTVTSTTDNVEQLVCEFPSQPGTATIPASLLSQLPASTQLFLSTGSGVRLSAGDYKIDLLASAPVIEPGTSAIVQVVLR